MLMSTTDTLPNARPYEVLGLVYASTLNTRRTNFFTSRTMDPAVINYDATREKLAAKAAAMGADAVIGIRFGPVSTGAAHQHADGHRHQVPARLSRLTCSPPHTTPQVLARVAFCYNSRWEKDPSELDFERAEQQYQQVVGGSCHRLGPDFMRGGVGEPTVGLEPTTCGLQNRCSAIELRRRMSCGTRWAGARAPARRNPRGTRSIAAAAGRCQA